MKSKRTRDSRTNDRIVAAYSQMDAVALSTEYPDMVDAVIVETILSRYASFVEPNVRIPKNCSLPLMRIPQQNSTDLAYLRHLAKRNGFVFQIKASGGGLPVAYWGPLLDIMSTGKIRFPPAEVPVRIAPQSPSFPVDVVATESRRPLSAELVPVVVKGGGTASV